MSEQNYANVQQQAELMKYISDNMKIPVLGAGGGFAPIGTLNFYDGILAPQGWLICDGTVYNIADYPELASHYASHHGASNFYGGNGTTTFAVPDWREVCLVGAGENTTLSISDHDVYSVGQFKDDQLQTHEHNGIVNVSGLYNIGSGSRGTATTGDALSPARTGTTTHGKQVGALICVKATVSGDANAHQYSTEEQVIGKDEDGNDIYERVIKGTTPSTAETPETIESVSGINLLSVYGMIDGRYPIGYSYLNQSTGPQYVSTIYINGSKTQLLICVDNFLTSKSYRAVIQYTKTQ